MSSQPTQLVSAAQRNPTAPYPRFKEKDSYTTLVLLVWTRKRFDFGLAWLGLAWLGLAWLGSAWLGLAKIDK